MSKGKLAKFADMAANPLVIEQPFNTITEETVFELRGRWHDLFFHNPAPIVLELGCGRGEYTVGLARRYSDKHPATTGDACAETRGKNFIGVDIKGARMWTGAQEALNSGMTNVAFLRTHIEFIDRFFAPGEVSEIWLTFSDPQMKKATKRLTSTYFLQRYRRFLTDGGLIHLKTDSNFLYTYTEEMLKANGIEPEYATRDLYNVGTRRVASDAMTTMGGRDTSRPYDNPGLEARSIQTYYEQMWRERGIPIKYLRFRLPHEGSLIEPDVKIPLDEYRSYNRSKRSGSDTGR